jgi:uncharacterized protein YwgA
MDIPVQLYAPYGTPHDELQKEFLAFANDNCGVSMPEPDFVKPAWIALVEALQRIEKEPYHWPVGRTTFQKMAYIATREGLPTGLNFQKSSFGPFAPELKGQITRLLNNGLIKEERLGRMFAVRVGPTFEDARCAYLDSINQWDEIIERITDLFCRTNTSQSEIVATVLFSASSLESSFLRKPSEYDIFDDVRNWEQHNKPPFEDQDIADTIRNLAALGWLNIEPSNELPFQEDELVDECPISTG